MISWSTSDVAGIHFGDSHILATRLSHKGKGPYALTHADWVPYDSGASEKVISGVVRALWKQANIPTRTICATLRSASLVMRYFKYPSMSAEELRSALELQGEEALQIPRRDLIVDWHLNRGEYSSGARGKAIEGVFFAAPVKDVDRALNILFLAGLDPIILDVRALAVANLFSVLGEKRDESALCLVNLSPHSADVMVMTKSGSIYPYTVLCRATTWTEAPEFLTENIRDVLKYCDFKLDWEPVRRIVLTGEVPLGTEFARKIQEGVHLPVESWNPMSSLDLTAKRVKARLDADTLSGNMLGPCLGLSLRRG